MHTVIRLSGGHLLPASRPAGHLYCSTKNALPPTLDQHRNANCPAGHQPTPELQYSNNAEAPDALRGTNQRLSSSLPLLLTAKTCFAGDSLLRFQHGRCHPRGRSPR
ncbi:hypothetical protein LF1_56650 [Rubripirellula obstinata]|uniref:Uncharacterized protein n=1 Tax=Rubripirellula obstinata TaxID=406547 RepID=A0A5B1C7G1_9BACT|nr:hypothetical protein LF1_56650 [Rubripirellula obstinata]